jgi:hypothetical protein
MLGNSKTLAGIELGQIFRISKMGIKGRTLGSRDITILLHLPMSFNQTMTMYILLIVFLTLTLT